MASIPPRTSYTMSPHLRTPDADNRQNSLALVPITTKDSSPATGAFPNGRSPLSSLGTNNVGGFGMRQRRQPQSFEGSSPFFKGGDAVKGPPRASLTMTMGGSNGSSGMVAPRSDAMKNGQIVDKGSFQQDENWILVFGFSNKGQREEVLRKFKSMGNVTDIKMASGSKNWVALCYDSKLTLEKAVCERDFQTSDGSFCGVRRLSNSREFFLEQQRLYTSVISHSPDGDSADEPISLFAKTMKDSATTEATDIEEKDILMTPGAEKGPAKGKTCCESFMGWIYGW